MSVYYNEHDPFAAAWLRELIRDNLIAPGEVDERSIEDVTPNELRSFRQCHFFAGIGVWSLAARRAGIPDDASLWTGSCPCQPFSSPGKGGGFADERHLWPSFDYLIEQCGPSIIAGEQVAGAGAEVWIDLVSADLDAKGYAFGVVETCAAGFGAPHRRPRNYWVASNNYGIGGGGSITSVDIGEIGPWGACSSEDLLSIVTSPFTHGGRYPQPLIRALDDGIAPRSMDVLRGAGNAVDARQAEAFLRAVIASVGRWW